MRKQWYLIWFSLLSGSIVLYILYLLYRIAPISFGSVVFYCRSLLSTTMEFLPFVGFGGFVAFVLLRLWIWKNQMKAIHSLPVLSSSRKLEIACKGADIVSNLYAVKSTAVFAFCYGLTKPAIYVSSQLINNMSVRELRSILIHEQAHISQNDTRIITLMRTISFVLFPFPFLWELTCAYSTEQEISADKAVSMKMGSYAHIRSALKKILALPVQPELPVLALPFSGYVMYAARIQSFKGQKVTITLPYSAVYISLLSLFLFSIALLLPVNKTEYEVNNQHYVVMCYQNQSCEFSCLQQDHSSKELQPLEKEIQRLSSAR